MAFIELKRVNRSNEEKVVLLNTEKVLGVTAIHTMGKTLDLYDEDGELVETKVVEDAPLRYRVFVEGTTAEIIIDEENYNALKKVLVK